MPVAYFFRVPTTSPSAVPKTRWPDAAVGRGIPGASSPPPWTCPPQMKYTILPGNLYGSCSFDLIRGGETALGRMAWSASVDTPHGTVTRSAPDFGRGGSATSCWPTMGRHEATSLLTSPFNSPRPAARMRCEWNPALSTQRTESSRRWRAIAHAARGMYSIRANNRPCWTPWTRFHGRRRVRTVDRSRCRSKSPRSNDASDGAERRRAGRLPVRRSLLGSGSR